MELNEIKLLLQGMQKDIDSKFTALESQILKNEEKITSTVNTHMNEKFEGLYRDLHEMRTCLDNQEKRLYYLEKSSVERNLVFFGLNENENSYNDLEDNILNIINQKMEVPTQALEIQVVKRIGKKGTKPRPVSVTFTTLGSKINILKHKKRLQGSGIHITPEFPAAILEKRRSLKEQLKVELEKGNVAYIKYDKLVIKEKRPTNTNTHKKRPLSASPNQPLTTTERENANDSTSTQTCKVNQAAKKHRAYKNSMYAYVKHSSEV